MAFNERKAGNIIRNVVLGGAAIAGAIILYTCDGKNNTAADTRHYKTDSLITARADRTDSLINNVHGHVLDLEDKVNEGFKRTDSRIDTVLKNQKDIKECLQCDDGSKYKKKSPGKKPPVNKVPTQTPTLPPTTAPTTVPQPTYSSMPCNSCDDEACATNMPLTGYGYLKNGIIYENKFVEKGKFVFTPVAFVKNDSVFSASGTNIAELVLSESDLKGGFNWDAKINPNKKVLDCYTPSTSKNPKKVKFIGKLFPNSSANSDDNTPVYTSNAGNGKTVVKVKIKNSIVAGGDVYTTGTPVNNRTMGFSSGYVPVGYINGFRGTAMPQMQINGQIYNQMYSNQAFNGVLNVRMSTMPNPVQRAMNAQFMYTWR